MESHDGKYVLEGSWGGYSFFAVIVVLNYGGFVDAFNDLVLID